MKKRLVVLTILTILVTWVGLGVYFVVYDFDVKEIVSEKINKPVVEEPEVSEISFIAVGDSLVHSAVYNAAKTSGGYNFKPMLKFVKEIVTDYDLAFYNQETILGGVELGLSTWPRFNSPQELGDNMIDTGFNLVSRANNHTLDKGEKAILKAEEYWDEQTDVLTAGSYISEAERTEVKIREINDITYTLLSYTTVTNGLKAPTGKEYYIDTYDEAKVKADIERIGDQVDIIIVSMHWGSEYTFVPTAQEKQIAEYLSSLGVDIVVGHHPHVIQPVQYVGDTLVIYSLGNLISAQLELMKKIGLMVSLKITKTEFKGETTIEISNIEGTLLYNPNTSSLGKYVIYPFTKVDSSILSNCDSVYKQYSAYVKLDDTITMTGLKNQSQ